MISIILSLVGAKIKEGNTKNHVLGVDKEGKMVRWANEDAWRLEKR